jgi:hypothetical protein
MIDPQQELFTKVKLAAEAVIGKENVYDGFLPPEDTPYPFVYLGDAYQVDDANKSAIFGTVSLTVHVWHNTPEERGTVSSLMLKIKEAVMQLKGGHYAWDYRNGQTRILTDNTTKQPLLHGVVELHFHFS